MKKESKETPDWRLILTICIGVVVLAILVTIKDKKSINSFDTETSKQQIEDK